MVNSSILLLLANHFLFVDAESLIRNGGLVVVFLVVYATTGLFFCFFIPSGGVLFTAGVLVASGGLPQGILTVCCLLVVASITGTLTGYGFGWKAREYLYSRKDSKFFRRQHLLAAEKFYNKHGGLAFTAGYFLPIIRTFAPVLAGMIKLRFSRFILFAFTGSVAWICSFVLAGYFIGSRPFLKPWLTYIVIGFILVITVPLVFRIVKEMNKKSSSGNSK